MLQFKIGAFLSLASIQPFSLTYETVWDFQPLGVNGRPCTAFLIYSCMPPFGKIVNKTYPVFRPNEFLWANHKLENESKAGCYMRVMREIMLKEDGYNDSPLSCEHSFEYDAACAGGNYDMAKFA